jgi:tetratricopeptide (TPR) repeat protein
VQQADGRPAGLLNAFARETVEMLSGRERLITDGVLDNHLLLAAHERGRPLKTIDLTAGSSPVYMKYVASLFDAVQLQNLARLGPLPLLKEWFETEPGVERRVAVTRVPDLWRAAGFQAVPHRLLFIGAKSLSSADAARLMREHEPFWASALPRLKALTAQGGALGAAGRHLAQTAGLVANNLGVLLEDAERPGDAFAAYRKARELDPENVSALLNLNIMVEKGWATNEAEAIRGDLQELLASAESRRGSLWSLARTYGYVRAPEAYVRLGRTWALSGNPGLAVSDLKRAMAMLPDRQRDVVRQMLANVYLSQEKVEEGETLYEEMLQKDGRNVRALLGLSSLALRRGDHARAEALLGRAEEAGAPPPQVGVARALLRQAQGDPAAARAELQELVAAHPEHLPAHVALADVLLLQGDTGALGDCLVRLSRLPGSAGPVASLRASLAAQQYDWGGAARYLSEALAAMPGNVQLLERLVTVELFEGRPEQAEADARRLLALDPQNAVGHYVMAVQQIREGRHELAEDSLRRSLRRRRAVPALNDLAWLLSERGASEEAEALVREALAADPQLAQGWDTLGVILLRRGRLADAQTALERSLSLHQGDAATFLHLTEVNVARGNMSRAQELIHVLYDKVSQLSRKDQEKLNGLSRQVDEARAGRGGSEK